MIKFVSGLWNKLISKWIAACESHKHHKSQNLLYSWPHSDLSEGPDGALISAFL